jgi:hypothetical protein
MNLLFRKVTMFMMLGMILASCGGDGAPNPSATPTRGVESDQTRDAGGRPTVDPLELTAFANLTPTIGPTLTAAAGTGQALAISTTANQPCTEQRDEDTGFMTFDQYFVNIKCIEPYFPWPMDRRIDWEKYQAMFAGSEGGFGPGFEYSGIVSFHVCAWFETWLDAYSTGNIERASAAMDVMLNFIPNYESNVPGFPDDVFDGESPYLDRAQSAALGDPTRIQSYVNGNCGWLPGWKTGS